MLLQVLHVAPVVSAFARAPRAFGSVVSSSPVVVSASRGRETTMASACLPAGLKQSLSCYFYGKWGLVGCGFARRQTFNCSVPSYFLLRAAFLCWTVQYIREQGREEITREYFGVGFAVNCAALEAVLLVRRCSESILDMFLHRRKK